MHQITDAIDDVLEFLRGNQLGKHAIYNYQSTYRIILAFCERKELAWFSHNEAMEFSDLQKDRYESRQISRDYFLQLKKSAFPLADCMQGNELELRTASNPKKSLGGYFTRAINEWEASLSSSVAPSTITGAKSYIRQFLFFLEGRGQYDFALLTDECVRDFLASMADTHRNSMSVLTWSMRKFLSHLNDSSISKIKAARYLQQPAPNQKKVLPCFSEQERASILSAVDTKTHLGKRDYAILKLAAETGLRGVDVFDLELTDIDWRTCEIALVQSKTGDPVHLPLMPDVGNAIADYILHARPMSNSSHVFLRVNAPHTKLSAAGSGKHIVNRYLEKAGINHRAWDGKTFHAFRRTYGTQLVKSGVPLQTVAQLLGHRDVDSAKRYISQNDAMLRFCSLDIAAYATSKEGLR